MYTNMGQALKKQKAFMMEETQKRTLENAKINEKIDKLKDLERKPEESPGGYAFNNK